MTRRVRSTDSVTVALPDGWHYQCTGAPDIYEVTHNGIPVAEMWWKDSSVRHPSLHMADLCYGLNCGPNAGDQ